MSNNFANAKQVFLEAAGFGPAEIAGSRRLSALQGNEMAPAASLPDLSSSTRSPKGRGKMLMTARYPGNWHSLPLPADRSGIPEGYTSPYSQPVLGFKNGERVGGKKGARRGRGKSKKQAAKTR